MFDILTWPNDILLEKCTTASVDEVAEVVDEMFQTMYANNGVGLAAPQIGILKRFFITNCSPNKEKSQEFVFINPEIIETSGIQKGVEGCLSFPGEWTQKERPAEVIVVASGLSGKRFKMKAKGFLARCILHEYDHCEGKVFIDDIEKRNFIRKKS